MKRVEAAQTASAVGLGQGLSTLRNWVKLLEQCNDGDFFNSLKTDRVHGTRYATRDKAIADLLEYAELFYNRRRRHSMLCGKPRRDFWKNRSITQHAQELAA